MNRREAIIAGAAGEIGWFLHDSTLCGRKFLRLRLEDQNQDCGIRPEVFDILESVDKDYLNGRLRKGDLTTVPYPTFVLVIISG